MERASTAHATLVPFNSALLFNSQGQRIFSYDKIHLVPFGEYEPFPLIHEVVNRVSDEVGGFRKGQTYGVGPLPGGYSLGVFICYEAIYPGEIRRFAADGATLLVNISNDGWFGRSAAARQHLLMARVRAVENRRWLLRVTNNGYTASVDPYGRMYEPLPTGCARERRFAIRFSHRPHAFTRDLEIGSPGSAWRFPLFCWPQLSGKEMFRAIVFRYR